MNVDADGMPLASQKSQKRRMREEQDPRVLFFGGFGPEISEETLKRFAEQAGEVKKVKLFYNIQTWESKGCGKVNYADLESAERAVNELSGTVLSERIVTIEPLGQSSNPNPDAKRHRPLQQARHDDLIDDVPKQLPLSMFSGMETKQQKLDMCYAAFDDLLMSHDPEKTGVTMILMIRKLVMEVNDIFGEDEESLRTWCTHLRQYSWFREHQQVVKWQDSKKRVNISKISSNNDGYINHAKGVRQMVEQRKLEQQMMGKPIFEASAEEAAKARRGPPAIWNDKGAGKGGYGYGAAIAYA
jgi:RNA recognition motif-containing protein